MALHDFRRAFESMQSDLVAVEIEGNDTVAVEVIDLNGRLEFGRFRLTWDEALILATALHEAGSRLGATRVDTAPVSLPYDRDSGGA